MKVFSPLWLAICMSLGLSCCAVVSATAGDIIRVHGSVSVAMPLVEAGSVLQREQGLNVQISTLGGSSGGIDALGEGRAEVALSTRPLSAGDRAAFPDISFTTIPIGMQAIALAVPKAVWEGGVHALSAEQVRDIYEGKIRNWKEVGGPDLKIAMLMSEQGRGLWELFAQWLYGDLRKAPVEKYPQVTTYEATRKALLETPGSFSQIPMAFIDRQSLFALAIRDGAGAPAPVEPTPENFVNGKYPLCRDLLLIVNNRPTLGVKRLVDLMLSERGQAMVKKVSLIPLAELGKDKAQ